jgi:hypothetical protein
MNEFPSSDVKPVTKEIKETPKDTYEYQKVMDKNGPKPLMRYFDLIDETTSCYVLGYN